MTAGALFGGIEGRGPKFSFQPLHLKRHSIKPQNSSNYRKQDSEKFLLLDLLALAH
jgi:hypothetical protein